jgi:hypothetical protein
MRLTITDDRDSSGSLDMSLLSLRAGAGFHVYNREVDKWNFERKR